MAERVAALIRTRNGKAPVGCQDEMVVLELLCAVNMNGSAPVLKVHMPYHWIGSNIRTIMRETFPEILTRL